MSVPVPQIPLQLRRNYPHRWALSRRAGDDKAKPLSLGRFRSLFSPNYFTHIYSFVRHFYPKWLIIVSYNLTLTLTLILNGNLLTLTLTLSPKPPDPKLQQYKDNNDNKNAFFSVNILWIFLTNVHVQQKYHRVELIIIRRHKLRYKLTLHQ